MNDDDPEPITTGRSVALVAIAVALMLSGGVYYSVAIIERVDLVRSERDAAVRTLIGEINKPKAESVISADSRWESQIAEHSLASSSPFTNATQAKQWFNDYVDVLYAAQSRLPQKE